MESAVDTRSTPPSRRNLRVYLAGGGVSAALISAAVVAFASLGAFVAFNGAPSGSGDSADASVSLAPEAAAVAAGPTARAVAPTPATPSDAARAEILAALPPGAAGGSGSGTGAVLGGSDPGTLAASAGGGAGSSSTAPTSGSGPLGETVGAVEDTARNLGLDLQLKDSTKDITKSLDGKVKEAANGLTGGLLK